jgi:hypothetical protein
MQARQLLADLGVSPDNIFSADLSPDNPASLSALKVALQGCEALVICTSAVPQPHVLATLWGAAGHFIRQRLRRDSTDDPFVPVATWKGGQTPQQVPDCSVAYYLDLQQLWLARLEVPCVQSHTARHWLMHPKQQPN